MADLALSAVVILKSWSEGGTTGKEYSCRQVSLTLTGQGGGTNKIPASALSLTKIVDCSNFITDNSDTIVPAAPSHDGTYLALMNSEQVTDAERGTPADFTSVVLIGTVKGY